MAANDPWVEIRGILSRVENRLGEMHNEILDMQHIQTSHGKRIDRVEHELFGNGRAGLAVQVRAILWIATGCLAFLVMMAAEMVAKLL